MIDRKRDKFKFDYEKNLESCSFCLEKHGHVCAKCCENRHTLVKRELNELKARLDRMEKYLRENP